MIFVAAMTAMAAMAVMAVTLAKTTMAKNSKMGISDVSPVFAVMY